jgi:hypothetical protein
MTTIRSHKYIVVLDDKGIDLHMEGSHHYSLTHYSHHPHPPKNYLNNSNPIQSLTNPSLTHPTTSTPPKTLAPITS